MSLMDGFSPVTRQVPLWLDGQVAARLDDLERRLLIEAAKDDAQNRDPVAPGILAEIVEVQQSVEPTVLTVAAIGARKWLALKDAHPPTDEQADDYDHNPDTFAPAAVAACIVDPVVTAEEVAEMYDSVSLAQWNRLWSGVLHVNTEADEAPKSLLGTVAAGLSVSGSITPALTESR